MFTWQAHEGTVTALAFAPDGRLLSAAQDGKVKLWAPFGSELLYSQEYAGRAESSFPIFPRLAIDGSGSFAAIVIGREAPVIRFDALETGELLSRAATRLDKMVPHPNGSSVLVCTAGQTPWEIRELEFPSGALRSKSKQPIPRPRTGLAISPDGSQVLAGSIRLRWPEGEVIGTQIPGLPSVRVIDPENDQILAPVGSRLGVWGFQTGAPRKRIKGHIAPITALEFTRDGRKLWTAAADATVKCWDTATLAVEHTYGLRAGPLASLAVSPDGSLAAAGSIKNGKITLWDLN